MKQIINHFKENFSLRIYLGLIFGLIAFPLVLGGCVFKKDFVRYKKQQAKVVQKQAKVVQKQAEVVQAQQTEANKKQTNRIQWLERSLRRYKKLQRLQRRNDQAWVVRGVFMVRNMSLLVAYDVFSLKQFSSYMYGRIFKLAENVYGDGAYFFIGMGYYRAGNHRMALLRFNDSILLLEDRTKRRKAKCGKKSCKLYLADSLYFRAIVCSAQRMTKKAMEDLHRLDKLKLLKKYKKFWEDPRFKNLRGLPAWLKLVKKYKKEKKK